MLVLPKVTTAPRLMLDSVVTLALLVASLATFVSIPVDPVAVFVLFEAWFVTFCRMPLNPVVTGLDAALLDFAGIVGVVCIPKCANVEAFVVMTCSVIKLGLEAPTNSNVFGTDH
jgi:hypothetical protein